MAIFRRTTMHQHWYVLASEPDANLMERLTALKGVPPAVKTTLLELSDLT